MSTRTYIGQADVKTGTWKAIYVHMDGNPLSVLPTLGALYARTGSVDGVMDLLRTDGATHWASIDHEQIDPSEFLPLDPAWAKFPFGSDERRAWNWFEHNADGESIAHKGIGVAIATPMGIEAPCGTLHEGYTESENAPADAEWAYIFTPSELVILRPKVFMEESTMVEVDRVALADLATLPADTLARINYGTAFERINPYAWSIDSEVPKESRDLLARTWLGLDPLTPNDAIGVHYKKSKKTYRFTGSYSSDGKVRTVHTIADDGRPVDIKLKLDNWSIKTAPSGAEFVYPKTKVDLVTP